MYLAQTALEEGDVDTVIEVYSRMVEEYPDHVLTRMAHWELANQAADAGDRQGAVEHLERVANWDDRVAEDDVFRVRAQQALELLQAGEVAR